MGFWVGPVRLDPWVIMEDGGYGDSVGGINGVCVHIPIYIQDSD